MNETSFFCYRLKQFGECCGSQCGACQDKEQSICAAAGELPEPVAFINRERWDSDDYGPTVCFTVCFSDTKTGNIEQPLYGPEVLDLLRKAEAARDALRKALEKLVVEIDALRKDAERLNYWAENAAGEFLFDETNHEFIKFLPKKPPRPIKLVKAAIDAAIAGKGE